MATYAIGDIQGCFVTFQRLLELVRFRPNADRLVLLGDIVNRGPRSLDTIRYVYDHRRSVTMVLGNHDTHFIARAYGTISPGRSDTLDGLLRDSDCRRYADWLRAQPLMVEERDFVFVHAGLYPSWSLSEAAVLAREGESVLVTPDGGVEALRLMRGQPPAWARDHEGVVRLRAIFFGFTRMRTLFSDGRPCSTYSGVLEKIPPDTFPWYAHPSRKDQPKTILFGHWAALGLHRAQNTICLDTGCVWRGKLTALRLDDGAVFQEDYADD